MPTIRVELFEGRTAEQKREFAHGVTELCVSVLGGTRAGVDVLFFDLKKSDWASGGTLYSELPVKPLGDNLGSMPGVTGV